MKKCSLYCLFEVFFVFERLRMQKNLYLWSRQHVTAKTVSSLKIEQNIYLLRRVTLKSVDFSVKPLTFDFTLLCDRKDVNFTQITAQN